MLYTKKNLLKLLQNKNVTTTAKSIAQLLLIAMDNGFVSRDDVLGEPTELKRPRGRPRKTREESKDESKEPKKPRGRPRKYPPKIVDPDKPKDPKYDRLRSIRKSPVPVTITDTETGEITSFSSQYKASKATGKDDKFFARNNGKVVRGKHYKLG